MKQIPGAEKAGCPVRIRPRALSPSLPFFCSLLVLTLTMSLGASTAWAMEIEFQNVAEEVGLQYMGPSFGVSWGDYDLDGRPDLFMNNHATPSTIFRNIAPGGFQDVSDLVAGYLRGETHTCSCGFGPDSPLHEDAAKTVRGTLSGDVHAGEWVDFDNDGDRDLMIEVGGAGGGGYEPNRLLINDNGGFYEAAALWGLDELASRGRTPLWFDWNNDGNLDALLACYHRSDGQDPTSIFTQEDGVFVNDNEYLGFGTDQDNTFAQLMYVSDRPQPLVLIHSKWPFPDRVYDPSTVPFTNVQTEIGLPSYSAVHDFVSGDFDGDLETELYLSRSDAHSAIAQTDSNEIRVKIKGHAGTLLGYRFETQDFLSFEMGPSWDVYTNDVFIGSGGQHPASLSFTLDPEDPSTWGDPEISPDVRGPRIFLDTETQQWNVMIEGTMEFGIMNTSTEAISNLETIGFNPALTPKPDRLLDRVGDTYQNIGWSSAVGFDRASLSVVAADFDNDMDLDIYLVCGDAAHNLPNVLLENDGTGQFTEVVGAAGASGTSGGMGDSAALADFNSDGFMDILVTNGADQTPLNLDGPTELFQNMGNDNHWLGIDLQGSTSNAEGIGAVVYVDAGGTRQVRFQDGGMHRFSQNHSRLHFGLAGHTMVDLIEIRWPSGLVEQLADIPADQIVRIREGEGVLSAVDLPPLSSEPVLHPAVPNPFNPRTSIAFDLPLQASVRLGIYDVSGRLIRTLLEGELLEQGRHEETWNGVTNQGRPAPAGVYFFRLDAGEFNQKRAMTLVK